MIMQCTKYRLYIYIYIYKSAREIVTRVSFKPGLDFGYQKWRNENMHVQVYFF